MDMTFARARLDWLAELAGASALAVGAGKAAFLAAPAAGWSAPAAMTIGGALGLVLGHGAMRALSAGPPRLPLADFAPGALEFTPAVEELLLDDRLEDLASGEDALLLEDPLPEAEPESRVVRLFAATRQPTAGELQQRIDRHLAGERLDPLPAPAPLRPQPADASAALFAALDELKRSLR